MEFAARNLCKEARETFKRTENTPLFLADWLSAAFVHLEVDPEILQREVPYKLDLRAGKAYISLVAFTMSRLRPRVGGRVTSAAFAPIAEHNFLNVRTYVAHEGERGIYFLLEWVSNRLAVLLGPGTFGLPYHYAKLNYCHDHTGIRDCIARGGHSLKFEARAAPQSACACAAGSIDEWFLERYIAFTRRGRTPMYFRVWHEPWPQVRLSVRITEDKLLCQNCPWYRNCGAKVVGGNFSRGVTDVWIGWPRYVKTQLNGCVPNRGLHHGN